MSEISDELREYCKDLYKGAPNYMTLMAIADRIDAEMVELPLSADRKIWTGREVCLWTGAGHEERRNFHDLVLRSNGWYVEDDCGNRYAAESVWHERPDSWECIADELEKWCDGADVDGDACDKPRNLAKRIRRLADNCSKAEKKEGQR